MALTEHDILKHWLQQQFPHSTFHLTPIPGDASFRRYFRFSVNNQNYIAVDSPPKTENNQAFVSVANAFSALGLKVPKVLAHDLSKGFLLLSDLGNDLFAMILNNDNADKLYRAALVELDKIQACNLALPAFDAEAMNKELELFRHWVVEKHLDLSISPATEKMLKTSFKKLLISATEQPQVCVHRDYHSRNLMIIDNQYIGILDFQDAVVGPVTYDAVSLLRDCYVNWPEDQVLQWLNFYHSQYAKKLVPSAEQFYNWFDLMGIQRHLKASFIFTRKFHRDDVSAYLNDMPRTLGYIKTISKNYSELRDFSDWIENSVAPIFEEEVKIKQ